MASSANQRLISVQAALTYYNAACLLYEAGRPEAAYRMLLHTSELATEGEFDADLAEKIAKAASDVADELDPIKSQDDGKIP